MVIKIIIKTLPLILKRPIFFLIKNFLRKIFVVVAVELQKRQLTITALNSFK